MLVNMANERPTCEMCGRTFATRKGVANHRRYHDPEYKSMMSSKLKGRKFSDESRRRMSEVAKGRRDSEETRRKKSERSKEMWSHPGYKEAYSKRNKGKHRLTDEQKAVLSRKAYERWADPEFHRVNAAKLAERNREPMSKKTKRKISQGQLKASKNPETFRRRSESRKALWRGEYRDKVVASVRKAVSSSEYRRNRSKIAKDINDQAVMTRRIRAGWSENAIRFCDDASFCKRYLESFDHKPTYAELLSSIGVNSQSIERAVRKFGLTDLIMTHRTSSTGEDELYELMSTYTDDVIRNDRVLLEGHELDLYCPSLKLAVEFNGEYWHSVERLGSSYHKTKSDMCAKAGVRLIHVFEWEWRDRRDACESIIVNAMHASDRVGARECGIVVPSKTEVDGFLETNTTYMPERYDRALALMLDDDMVAVMTVRESFGVMEVVDYADLNGMSISGGMSRLLMHLIESSDCNKVVARCDIAKFTGVSFTNMGFTMSGRTNPRPHVADGYTVYNCGDAIYELDL